MFETRVVILIIIFIKTEISCFMSMKLNLLNLYLLLLKLLLALYLITYAYRYFSNIKENIDMDILKKLVLLVLFLMRSLKTSSKGRLME